MAVYTTIDDPEAYFQVKTYTGNGSTNAQTLDGDTNMQPDLVWVKRRNGATKSFVFDNARAANFLQTESTDAEQDGADYFVSLDSDGFTFEGSDNSNNASSQTYVAWCWKESATSGFDIVTFTGNATDDRDISHSLSAVPHFWVTRNRPDVENWVVYHGANTSAPETDYLVLDDDNATGDSAGVWSDEAPTSSVYTVGTANSVNGNTDAMITWMWTEKQGFSKFGSYTGNGNADGAFVYTGFKPAFIMIKRTDSTGWWNIVDNKRLGYNPSQPRLYPNVQNAEDDSETNLDLLSNGFKLKVTSQYINYSGATYVYAAFAEAPFVNSKKVPNNAK